MMQPDDPPFLSVGTEVSAKYKGAFCEAKVHKVVKCVKIKVTYKCGLGSHFVSDEQIKGMLKVGSCVKAAHPDRATPQEAVITKIQDCSQYTVVFDDGDITTLRRTSLCLKSGRHFAESESLDQLPLTHPEHFGSPVVSSAGRRGTSRRHKTGRHGTSGSESSDSSGDEVDLYKSHMLRRNEWENDISKVVCVEVSESKKKQRDNWFPGLVVAPTAQDSVKIDTKKDWLVRSFQDGRYYTVPKKEATLFTREAGARVTLGSLKAAVDKALEFLDTDELPPHWDRNLLFGVDYSDQDTDGTESDESDDEPREEKDHFVAQLYKFMEECGTPINKAPTIANRDLDLYKLFKVVQKLGGFNRVINQNQLKVVSHKMNLSSLGSQGPSLIKTAYKKYLHSFEDFYRKLGCTMVSSPRRNARPRIKNSGRSLIRDRDRVDKSPNVTGNNRNNKATTKTVANKKLQKEMSSGDTEEAGGVARDARSCSRVTRQDTVSKSPDRPSSPHPPSPVVANKDECPDGTKVPVSRGSSSGGRSDTPTSSAKSKYAEEAPNEGRRKTSKKEIPRSKEDSDSPDDDEEEEEEEEVEEDDEKSSKCGRTRRQPREGSREKSVGRSKIGSTPARRKLLHCSSFGSLEFENDSDSQDNESCNSSASGSVNGSDHAVACKRRGTGRGMPTSGRGFGAGRGRGLSRGGGTASRLGIPSSDDLDSKFVKRNKKRRTDSDSIADSDVHVCVNAGLPSHIPVSIGDRLQVVYGQPDDIQSCVTYEAKVIEVSRDVVLCAVHSAASESYYVHYPGWNSRYDEWVPRCSIARNLCYTPNTRVRNSNSATKKDASASANGPSNKTVVASCIVSTSSSCVSASLSSLGSSRRGQGSRASSSSSTRSSKDMAEDNSKTDSGAARHKGSESVQTSSPSEDLPKTIKGHPILAESATESESEVSDTEVRGVRSGCRRVYEARPSAKERPKQTDVSDAEEAVRRDSCSRDIDLKAIESEMKGLERPVKKEEDLVTSSLPGTVAPHAYDGPRLQRLNQQRKLQEAPLRPLESPPKRNHSKLDKGMMTPSKADCFEDDIYEFKEPEPFDISEMRSRKEGRGSRGLASPQEEFSDSESRDVGKKKSKMKRENESDTSDEGGATPKKLLWEASKETLQMKQESPLKIERSSVSPVKSESVDDKALRHVIKAELTPSKAVKAECELEPISPCSPTHKTMVNPAELKAPLVAALGVLQKKGAPTTASIRDIKVVKVDLNAGGSPLSKLSKGEVVGKVTSIARPSLQTANVSSSISTIASVGSSFISAGIVDSSLVNPHILAQSMPVKESRLNKPSGKDSLPIRLNKSVEDSNCLYKRNLSSPSVVNPGVSHKPPLNPLPNVLSSLDDKQDCKVTSFIHRQKQIFPHLLSSPVAEDGAEPESFCQDESLSMSGVHSSSSSQSLNCCTPKTTNYSASKTVNNSPASTTMNGSASQTTNSSVSLATISSASQTIISCTSQFVKSSALPSVISSVSQCMNNPASPVVNDPASPAVNSSAPHTVVGCAPQSASCCSADQSLPIVSSVPLAVIPPASQPLSVSSVSPSLSCPRQPPPTVDQAKGVVAQALVEKSIESVIQRMRQLPEESPKAVSSSVSSGCVQSILDNDAVPEIVQKKLVCRGKKKAQTITVNSKVKKLRVKCSEAPKKDLCKKIVDKRKDNELYDSVSEMKLFNSLESSVTSKSSSQVHRKKQRCLSSLATPPLTCPDSSEKENSKSNDEQSVDMSKDICEADAGVGELLCEETILPSSPQEQVVPDAPLNMVAGEYRSVLSPFIKHQEQHLPVMVSSPLLTASSPRHAVMHQKFGRQEPFSLSYSATSAEAKHWAPDRPYDVLMEDSALSLTSVIYDSEHRYTAYNNNNSKLYHAHLLNEAAPNNLLPEVSAALNTPKHVSVDDVCSKHVVTAASKGVKTQRKAVPKTVRTHDRNRATRGVHHSPSPGSLCSSDGDSLSAREFVKDTEESSSGRSVGSSTPKSAMEETSEDHDTLEDDQTHVLEDTDTEDSGADSFTRKQGSREHGIGRRRRFPSCTEHNSNKDVISSAGAGHSDANTISSETASGLRRIRSGRVAVGVDDEDSNHSRPSNSCGRRTSASKTRKQHKKKRKSTGVAHPYRQYRNTMISEGGVCRPLEGTFAGRDPPVGRFNFLQSIDHLSQEQRIDELNRRMSDLRKVYAECKSNIASIERKKKNIRKRDSKRQIEENKSGGDS